MTISAEDRARADRIRALREGRNLTIRTCAKAVGLSVGSISKIENGHSNMSLGVAIKLAEVLGVSIDYLVSGEVRRQKKGA
jgi:transcriptional regulator with XRE-family HTH domain